MVLGKVPGSLKKALLKVDIRICGRFGVGISRLMIGLI